MVGGVILTFSAAVLLLMGGAGLFAAHEVAGWFGAPDSVPTAVIIQMAASGMLGLSFMNWLSRKNPIGGIYGRPLCLANLVLFASSGLSIDKALTARQLPLIWTPLGVAISGLALMFAWLVFVHAPATGSSQTNQP